MKGQTSAEYLTIFSVAFLVVLFLSVIAYSEADALISQYYDRQAMFAVKRLLSEGETMLYQGKDAFEVVAIYLPPSYNPTLSKIDDATQEIVIYSGNRPFVGVADFCIFGSLPAHSGYSNIRIENNGTCIIYTPV